MHPAAVFVEALTGDPATPMWWATFPDRTTPGAFPREMQGKLDDCLPVLEAQSAGGCGVFASLHSYLGVRSNATCVDVRACFVDGDNVEMPAKWGVPPTLLQMRDRTHWHALWRLAEGQHRDVWTPIQQGLAAFYGTDPSVCDLARVIRLPGFPHYKDPKNTAGYSIAQTRPSAYTLAQLAEAHGFAPASIVAKPTPPLNIEFTDAVRARVMEGLKAIDAYSASRHNALLSWITNATAAGMPQDEVSALAADWMREQGRDPGPGEIPRMTKAAEKKVRSGTATCSLPGLTAMTDFTPAEVPEDQAWTGLLQRTSKGALEIMEANVEVYLQHHPHLKGMLAWDALAVEIAVREPPPWPRAGSGAYWTDHDSECFCLWMQRTTHQRFRRDCVDLALRPVAKRVVFHPILEWLDAVTWDNQPRLDRWLTIATGCEDSPYAAFIGAKTLIAAVARVRKPGCKVDTVLVLEGWQGALKSTLLRELTGDQWYTDTSIRDVDDKDTAMKMRGKWIVEVAENGTFSKAHAEHLKAWISQRDDRQRDPFARKVQSVPRQSVLIGTTNRSDWGADDTGGRRFWPIRVTRCDLDWMRANHRQLWAEADARFKAGEIWWAEDGDPVLTTLRAQQAARYVADPSIALVSRWMAARPAGAPNPTTLEIAQLALATPTERLDRRASLRVSAIMRSLGYETDPASDPTNQSYLPTRYPAPVPPEVF